MNEDLQGSIYKVLQEKLNFVIFRSEYTIEAATADQEDAALLNISVGSPVLIMDRLVYLADNTPFEYAERLAELVQRQHQIEVDLDLTKNQASAQLGAEASPELPAAEPEVDCLKETYEANWE